LSKRATSALRGGGYTIKFTHADFDVLTASEFETRTSRAVGDDVPSEPTE